MSTTYSLLFFPFLLYVPLFSLRPSLPYLFLFLFLNFSPYICICLSEKKKLLTLSPCFCSFMFLIFFIFPSYSFLLTHFEGQFISLFLSHSSLSLSHHLAFSLLISYPLFYSPTFTLPFYSFLSYFFGSPFFVLCSYLSFPYSLPSFSFFPVCMILLLSIFSFLSPTPNIYASLSLSLTSFPVPVHPLLPRPAPPRPAPAQPRTISLAPVSLARRRPLLPIIRGN